MFTAITLIGGVTKDFELQYSQSGRAYAKFRLAVNKGYGEQKHPNYYNCIIFDKAAERIVNAKVKKGSQITIIGDLDIEEYTNPKTNAKGINHNVTVYDWDYVSFGKRPDSDNMDGNGTSDAGNGFSSTENCGPNGLPFN